MGRRVGDLDFGDFPNNITLTYGSDGEREYYEYWQIRHLLLSILRREFPEGFVFA
jgi:hypothetical protein